MLHVFLANNYLKNDFMKPPEKLLTFISMLIGVFVLTLAGFLPIDALLHLTNIGTLLAFDIVCAAVLIMRRST
jgi:amino acid transporter